MRWFVHVERKNSDDWVSACESFEVNGIRHRGKGRETCDECVKKYFVELGLHQEWALDDTTVVVARTRLKLRERAFIRRCSTSVESSSN